MSFYSAKGYAGGVSEGDDVFLGSFDAVVADGKGRVFLAGDDGIAVLDRRGNELATNRDVCARALACGPDGLLYAASGTDIQVRSSLCSQAKLLILSLRTYRRCLIRMVKTCETSKLRSLHT